MVDAGADQQDALSWVLKALREAGHGDAAACLEAKADGVVGSTPADRMLELSTCVPSSKSRQSPYVSCPRCSDLVVLIVAGVHPRWTASTPSVAQSRQRARPKLFHHGINTPHAEMHARAV